MWQRGLLKLIDFEGWIHRNCLVLWSSDVFFLEIHRNLMFLGHPDVSGISLLGTYIGNVRFRAFPMYCYSGFSRRYIGIEISMPIPMYVGPNLYIIYIGVGQHRLFPMYRQISPFKNTSEFKVFSQSRCISINFPRIYLHLLAIYSRASRPHFNFPRCCLYSLVAYSRANGVHYDLRGDSPEALSM